MEGNVEMLTVSNIVSVQTGEGLVSIELDGKLLARLNIEQAEEFARNVMRCASVAECEANLLKFLSKKFSLPLIDCAKILGEFRQYRNN